VARAASGSAARPGSTDVVQAMLGPRDLVRRRGASQGATGPAGCATIQRSMHESPANISRAQGRARPAANSVTSPRSTRKRSRHQSTMYARRVASSAASSGASDGSSCDTTMHARVSFVTARTRDISMADPSRKVASGMITSG